MYVLYVCVSEGIRVKYIQQGLEIHGLEKCGPWRYTVFNWVPKHLRYTVLAKNLEDALFLVFMY
jgi:hypothetical protein